jgi:preprotein translocase subunit SecF
MELFKNTNFDFLGKKWPFIILSLLLTAAGWISIATKGMRYGIDFKGGVQMSLRFAKEPPVQQIRSVLESKLPGEIVVQQVSGKPEVLIGTEIKDEKVLNANRQLIDDTLRGMFSDSASGKIDVNNSSSAELADRLRGPLQAAGVALSEQDLQDLCAAINAYRANHGGILQSADELSGVKGVTPKVIEVLKANVIMGPFTILGTQVVGPKIGAELELKAIEAVLYALAGMLVYIAFRFEWIYGVAAVVAVFHDTLITIGLFSLFNKPISLTVVAALLTLVGYSMNDTIVVFDRIRENLRLSRRESLPDVVNRSINQTLSRTVLTSGLTFLTVLSLYIFGGQVLRGFSFALVIGILIGTYSSIAVAAPMLVAWQQWRGTKGKAVVLPAAKRARS